MAMNGNEGFHFPVGYHRFHKKQLFNYQLNRPYSLGYARYEDLKEAGARISSFPEWKAEMLRQAEKAESEGRVMNAAFHYRAAEFYTLSNDPDKESFYRRFLDLFHSSFADHEIERFRIPCEGGFLSAFAVGPREGGRGAIVLHGGFDSFIEEFYSLARFFADAGFRVIAFDGPGQGAARRDAGLPFDYRWEKPVAALLDHLGLDDVTLIGLSLGGYLALRAAAFEKRVRRVIVSGHAYDYWKIAPALASKILIFFHDHFRGFTNRLSLKKVAKGGMEAWSIGHLMYILDVDEPMAALDFALELTEKNLHSERVEQDVLLLAGRKDHFIPFRLHQGQLDRLTSARSVTDRVFGPEEHAQNHCQIGNIGLALRTMRDWIDGRRT